MILYIYNSFLESLLFMLEIFCATNLNLIWQDVAWYELFSSNIIVVLITFSFIFSNRFVSFVGIISVLPRVCVSQIISEQQCIAVTKNCKLKISKDSNRFWAHIDKSSKRQWSRSLNLRTILDHAIDVEYRHACYNRSLSNIINHIAFRKFIEQVSILFERRGRSFFFLLFPILS